MLGARGLETGKDLEPVVDAPRREQQYRRALCTPSRTGSRESTFSKTATARSVRLCSCKMTPMLKSAAKQIRRERERALVRAQRFLALVQRLQRDAMVCNAYRRRSARAQAP